MNSVVENTIREGLTLKLVSKSFTHNFCTPPLKCGTYVGEDYEFGEQKLLEENEPHE